MTSPVARRFRQCWWLFSDGIHPNMVGHSLIVDTIVRTLLGRPVSLQSAGPPAGGIPYTIGLVHAGRHDSKFRR